MYDSPIEVYEQIPYIISEINNQKDNLVCEAVAKVGIDVDKNELLKALQYDREQYSKGYSDGKTDGVREFAEWLINSKYHGICNEGFMYGVSDLNFKFSVSRIDEILAEYEKEQKE